MSMILFPRAPGRVGGADSVGYHLGRDLKRLIVNRLPLGRAALRDPIEHVSVEIPKADVGKGERQAHFACEFEHLHKVERFIGEFIDRHHTALDKAARRQTQLLELSVLLASGEHYRRAGYAVRIRNPGKQRIFKVKTSTRGHPANFSSLEISRAADRFEI